EAGPVTGGNLTVRRGGLGGRGRVALLSFPVADGGLDRVLSQHRAVDLYRGKAELAHDVRVLDGERFLDGLAFDPLGGQRGAGDRRAAAEGLELRLFNYLRLGIDFHLQLHHVAALGRADQAGTHVGIFLGQATDVAGMVVVV